MSEDVKDLDEFLSDGLSDHSEELSERTETDAQIRFYRAMADTEIDYNRLLTKLARAVAEVLFDLCLVYLIEDETEELHCAAAYHPHPRTLHLLQASFGSDAHGPGAALLRRVVEQRESYFRPRWRPSLLQAYTEQQQNQLPPNSIHSLIAVPMITTDGKCLGALIVGRHTTQLAFDETDLALSEWIASHAAMKLETARLYRDLHRTNQRLDVAVQERDTFISVASHELRTPLGTLKLQAQILHRLATHKPEEFTPETVIPRLIAMDNQVDRIDNLVDQLLNVTRIMDGGMSLNLEPVELAHLLDEVVRRFSCELEQCGSELTVSCSETVRGLWDRDRLDHVVTNLVSNAIKYGRGKPISLEVIEHKDHVLLAVHDEGVGIKKESLPRIFERFERATRQYKGLGLGLWIVREYLESMGATIEVDSQLNVGSSFRVRLPL